MLKSDLRSGDVLITFDNTHYIVLMETETLHDSSGNIISYLDRYTEHMAYHPSQEVDDKDIIIWRRDGAIKELRTDKEIKIGKIELRIENLRWSLTKLEATKRSIMVEISQAFKAMEQLEKEV